MDITRLGVKNLRGFREIGSMQLKPINILVGKNSSGKSSIARLFPLFRQSFETKTKGPVLWFGQYVDFGSFDNAITKNSNNDSIQFTFHIKLNSRDDRGGFGISRLRHTRAFGSLLEDSEARIDIHLSYSDKTKSTFTSGYKMTLFGNTLEIEINDNGWVETIIANEEKFIFPSDTFGYVDSSELIPTISVVKDNNYRRDDQEADWELLSSYGENILINFLRVHTKGNLTKKTLMTFVRTLGFASDEKLLETESVKRSV